MQDLTVHPGASVGIAFGESNNSVEDLLRDGDIAMYLAKNSGKARWEIFQPGMRQTVTISVSKIVFVVGDDQHRNRRAVH
jgi:predicted signal transduction protein with EAL and GGDEF domain